MSGVRLSLAVPRASAAEVIETARLAERWNLASIWIGDPAGGDGLGDSYVTATAGALSVVTSFVRIGLFLSLQSSTQVVRLAEDLGVLDQASNGRVEVALPPPVRDRDDWLARAAAMLNAYQAWPVPGSREVLPVIPAPAQPELPLLVVDDIAAADSLRAGRLVSGPAVVAATLVEPRTVLRRALRPDARRWLTDDPLGQILELRDAARAARARELLLIADRTPSDDDMEVLGTVVVPGLRCADRDVRAITADAWDWTTTKRHLHAPPA
jgi:hypothetical protein